MGLTWMAWTWQTAAFFGCILLLLMGMTVWEWASPGGAPRRGILGIETTRGDRLFISLLGSAFIHLAWLGLVGPDLWWALGLSLIYAVAVFRWV
jgi:predicted small integral membrane protein